MRQPAGARVQGRLAYTLVCCRMPRDGERSAKGGGGGGIAGNGEHERALHRVPRRTFVKLRDDFVWDEPQVAPP